MEFQFGTNWARFSKAAGGVIGQTLAMEGVFSFFLESSFLGLFLFGEKRLGPRRIGSQPSWCFSARGFRDFSSSPPMRGCSIHRLPGDARWTDSSPESLGLLLNPWLFWQYMHNMIGAVVTGSFVMAAVGAFYLLSRRHEPYGRTFVRIASSPARSAQCSCCSPPATSKVRTSPSSNP